MVAFMVHRNCSQQKIISRYFHINFLFRFSTKINDFFRNSNKWQANFWFIIHFSLCSKSGSHQMVQWNKVFLLSHPLLQLIHCRSLLIFTYRQQITISSVWRIILVPTVLFLLPNHLLLPDLKSRRLALPVNVIKCSWKIKEPVNIQSLVFYLMQKLVPQGVRSG